MMGSNNADGPDGTAQLSLLFITKVKLRRLHCHYKCCNDALQEQPFWAANKGLVLKSCRQNPTLQ